MQDEASEVTGRESDDDDDSDEEAEAFGPRVQTAAMLRSGTRTSTRVPWPGLAVSVNCP